MRMPANHSIKPAVLRVLRRSKRYLIRKPQPTLAFSLHPPCKRLLLTAKLLNLIIHIRRNITYDYILVQKPVKLMTVNRKNIFILNPK